MFARISTFTLLALPILATATVVLPRTDGAACSATGTAQCCSSTQSVSRVSTYSSPEAERIVVIAHL